MNKLEKLLMLYKDNSIKKFDRKNLKAVEKFLSKNYPLKEYYNYKYLTVGCFQILYKKYAILQIEETINSNSYKLKISKDWYYDIDRDIKVRRIIEKNRNKILKDLLKFVENENKYINELNNKVSFLQKELLLIDWEEIININDKAYEISKKARTTIEEFEIAYDNYKLNL